MTEVITDPTPPILHGPSDKEKKYDRQLRLWAASGQQALEDADLLLLNSGAGTVGVETLKNLVLPGIGKFTIADEAIVTEQDLGVNFFLDEECLGQSRAECCVKLLQELNPDVKGEWQLKGESLEKLLEERKYTLILYSHPISSANLDLVKNYSSEHKAPLVAIHSAGFYSYFRIHLPGTFPIVDTHPDSTATTDLRLLTPWDELSSFVSEQTSGMEQMDAHTHGHIPYVALLLHFLAKWKGTHGSYPSNYKEKTEFKKLVASGARTNNPEGGEENFEEAAAAVNKTITTPSLSSSVRDVLDYKPNEFESSSSFWIIANAIKQFYNTHNALPLPGSVPDMKAQSAVYVQLQNIYKAKARKDASEVLETVRKNPSGNTVDAAEVDNFCKNAAFIKLVHDTQSKPVDIRDLAKIESENDLNSEFTLAPLSLLPIYLALDATRHATGATSSEDIVASINDKIDSALVTERFENIAEEVARARGGELHNISALTGGMVAQEVIKIITKQYVPIENTCIFDGITSRAQVLRI